MPQNRAFLLSEQQRGIYLELLRSAEADAEGHTEANDPWRLDFRKGEGNGLLAVHRAPSEERKVLYAAINFRPE